MEQYILNLLKENNRAILPDFGAFFIRQEDPYKIAFNSLLTFNDNMLVELVSKSEGLTYNDAATKVENYTRRLISELNKNKQVTIKQIGKIMIDESGEKEFTSWEYPDKKDTTADEDTIVTIEKEEHTDMKEAVTEEAAAVEEAAAAAAAAEEAAAAAVEEAAAAAAGGEEAATGIVPPSEEKPSFTLDDSLKEVDIDASGDSVKHPESEKRDDPMGHPQDPFTLEESEEEETEAAAAAAGVEKEAVAAAEAGIEEAVAAAEAGVGEEAAAAEAGVEEEAAAAGVEKEAVAAAEVEEEAAVAEAAAGAGVEKEAVAAEGMDDRVIETNNDKSTALSSVDQFPVRKKRKWILSIAVAGTLLIIISAAWFIFPDQIRNIFKTGLSGNEKNTPVEDAELITGENMEIVKPAEIGPDEAGATESTSPRQEAPQITERYIPPGDRNTGEKKYYIVAGCFEYMVNAEKYIAELQTKGYNAELFGKWKNLYAVSFNSFSSKDQALIEMYHIRQFAEPDAWVLYY